ncbi:MAG: hypothetical protein RLZ98_2303 [Pseudomonadota bacterium]|jgi:hypothetical protein
MSAPTETMPRANAATQPPSQNDDQRRYKRYVITLLGRFMRENKSEYPCRLVNISVGDATLNSPVEPEIGERIVVYFDHIGGLEGHVERVFDGGFAICLTISDHKREKLAAQLTWYINRHELDRDTMRRHPRYELANTTAKLTLSDETELNVQVLDVSISGASVKTTERPPVGSSIRLGKLRARVVRHHDQRLGVEFIDIQRPDALRKYFG